ncbi:hypothetical protein KRMM14A1259_72100 [Krasilnikovia sp. MM14-A1259]
MVALGARDYPPGCMWAAPPSGHDAGPPSSAKEVTLIMTERTVTPPELDERRRADVVAAGWLMPNLRE